MRKLLLSLVSAAVLSTSMYAVNYEQDIAPTKKFITEQEQKNTNYQDFIWEQEKVNKLQDQQNKGQEEFNKNQLDFNVAQRNFNEVVIDKFKNQVRPYVDLNDVERLRNKIYALESESDRLRSSNSRLDQRLMALERKVK